MRVTSGTASPSLRGVDWAFAKMEPKRAVLVKAEMKNAVLMVVQWIFSMDHCWMLDLDRARVLEKDMSHMVGVNKSKPHKIL